jgi:predicted membrane protein
MMKKLVAIFIILTGFVLFLSNLDVVNFNDVFGYLWPTFIILVGLAGIFTNKKADITNLIIILIGLHFLFIKLDLIEENLIRIVFFPIILILIGFNLLVKGDQVKKVSNRKSYTAIFGGIEEKNNDDNFTGCDITTIFGGVELDFSEIKIKEEKAIINITSLFGGAELTLPKDYKVTVQGTPIFGGCENKLREQTTKAKKELIINFVVAFGGIALKN